MGLPQRDTQLHTYGEYLAWPEEQRYELIEGVAYAMTPAPARIHQAMLGEIFRQIANALNESNCEVYIAPFDVRLPEPGEADDATMTVLQPDISVICDLNKLDERGCRGAPNQVIEILSPSTASHDQINKRAMYEKHGVKEFWLVHPGDRILTIYQLNEGSYGKPAIQELKGETMSTVLADIRIDWGKVTQNLRPMS